ncbi:hypothetical protein D3C81_1677240 [compost metagenome]
MLPAPRHSLAPPDRQVQKHDKLRRSLQFCPAHVRPQSSLESAGSYTLRAARYRHIPTAVPAVPSPHRAHASAKRMTGWRSDRHRHSHYAQSYAPNTYHSHIHRQAGLSGCTAILRLEPRRWKVHPMDRQQAQLPVQRLSPGSWHPADQVLPKKEDQ